MDNRPIGFFDSGLGGLSTLAECIRLLPRESYIYYADSDRAPFGNKSEAEVLTIAGDAIRYLASRRVKAVVIACNTATGIGAGALRERYRLEILGVEPALKPACENWRGGMILSLTTPATAKSRAFSSLIHRYAAEKPLLTASMPRWAPAIENHYGDEKKLSQILQEDLAEFSALPVESIVLGCTHYVFVRDLLIPLFPKAVEFYDGNNGTARNLARRLAQLNLLSDSVEGRTEIISTNPAKTEVYRSALSDRVNVW